MPRRILIIMAALLLVVTGCASSAPQRPAPPPPSAYDLVLRQVHPDGTVDPGTALAAFSLAVAPLPGVPAPPGPRRMIASGSAAVAWVLANWTRLTPEQQQAAQRALESGVAPAAFVQSGLSPRANPNLPCGTGDSPDAGPYRQVVDAVVTDIAGHLGRPLKLPIHLQVNTQQLAPQDNGKPSVMYTWPCQGTKTATGGDPTACAIHINPYAADGAFSDHDRRSFLIHEVMHCFSYDRFGLAYDTVAPWLAEGIPLWAQTALNGADPIATAHWNEYLPLDKTPLFKRTYDAIGFFAQLADSTVDVWHKVDAMTAAFLAGGNSAAWQAAGATDAFVDSWGAGYARGRQPGKNWDITGYGVPDTRPETVHFDLINSTSAEAAAPGGGVDLIELNLQSDVVGFGANAGAGGLFGASDGSERPVAAVAGQNFCTRPGGCTCPPGSAGEGEQLPALPRGLGYLALSGGLRPVRLTAAGESLDEFCAKPRRSCLVGTWTSGGFDISSAGGAITESGGTGAIMRIMPTGDATVDFSPMQSLTFHTKDTAGSLRYDGSSGGHLTLPPPGVTSGDFGDAHGNFSTITVTVTVTSPVRLTVFDHRPLAELVGMAQGLASGLSGGVSTQPLLGPGGFTCTPTTLTITPPPGSQVGGTWTLTRTG